VDATLRTLLDRVSRHAADAVALRHELHAMPELAHSEERTAARVADALATELLAGPGTAVVGELGRTGPRVAVRAELDGLPIAERTGVAWAGADGRMHACGHDVHMAATVALWRAGRDVADRLPFRLRVLFQPSEEQYPSGAQLLVDAGLLNDVDAIVGAHVHPEIPAGEVAVDPGAVNAACANFGLTIVGRGGHAAYPERAVDPIPALAAALAEITALRRPGADAMASVGVVRSDGSENIIPERAVVRGTVRGRSIADRDALLRRLAEATDAAVTQHGCRAELAVQEGEPALVNDATITAATRALLPLVGLRPSAPWRSFGADDFAFYGVATRTVMAFVGLRGMDGFAQHPLHHPAFLPPDAAVTQVALALAGLAWAAGTTGT
jgi:amidohydrolase